MDAASRRQLFAEAFAAQARSDWRVYRHLARLRLQSQGSSFPKCHDLHYLQMATEKIAKA